MANKLVKCVYCNNSFNREQEEGVKVKTRYAHLECHKKHMEEATQFKKLTDLIKDLYGTNEPNWKIIGTQLKKYKDEGMTYYGMFYTLVFFFQIKKNDITKSCGVGIIPYQYKKAQQYYEKVNNVYTQKAKVESQGKIKEEQTEDVIILPSKSKEKKLIDFNY